MPEVSTNQFFGQISFRHVQDDPRFTRRLNVLLNEGDLNGLTAKQVVEKYFAPQAEALIRRVMSERA